MNSIRPIEDIVFDLVDGHPCDWDHDHSCQEHGAFDVPEGGLCPMEEARLWLARHGSTEARRWLREWGYEIEGDHVTETG